VTGAALVIASELRARRSPDGAFWVASGFGHDYWSNVLGAPLPSTLVVRSEDIADEPAAAARLDGELVDVVALPPLRLAPSLPLDVVRALVILWRHDLPGIPVLRFPGITPSLVLLVTVLRRRRYAVQVVGDPIDVAFRAGVGGRPGRIAGVAQWAILRFACRRAAVCAYVTQGYLQRRYPPGPRATSLAVSNVVLGTPQEGSAARVRGGSVRRLVTVASLDQPYKRVDLLVEALALLRAEGWDVDLDIVGGGRLLGEIDEQCRRLGIDQHVERHGSVDPGRVRELLRRADLFVLCSDTEGLPRALVEAMAEGLPCVASEVGGVPELLGPEARFEPGSLVGLVGALRRFLVSPTLRELAATRNLERATNFSPVAMGEARRELRAAVIGTRS
jgi:glycosyltransferase involved in cell wall biosynthesis